MKKKTENLIKVLTEKHQPKPFWKNYHVLLSFWLCSNIIFLIIDTLQGTSGFKASFVFLSLNFLASLFGWFFFTQNLNGQMTKNRNIVVLVSLVFLTAFGFFYSDISGTVFHQRSFALSSDDITCFKHIVFLTLPAAIVYPFFLRNFFVQKPGWMLAFMITHVSLLSITVVERQCSNREFWHLILGHQSSYLGIIILFIAFYILMKKLASLIP